MYNSVTVTVLSKIWFALKLGYQYSILKKIMDAIGKGLKYISKGSNFLSLFSSNRKKTEESLFYTLYSKFIDFIYRIIEGLRKLIDKGKSGSIIDETVSYLFKDEKEVQNTISAFMLFFGFTVFLFNAVRGKFFGSNSFIVSFVIIILSLLSMKIEGGFKAIFKESNIYKILRNIFTIEDEGGEKWW